ncbi:MAG: chemotaxis protein CheA [Desulfovibrio aminophilus]|jgi:two-component system chemotaxis sensor kinase CheA|uniref:chemotaxis protein CheA n=1 Tax=Desulfovibrio aminophilus TaxID=81425 RepID=UPI00041A4466|nr:chemotaxis protein CheW [Desulfovibrio aminophilus]
MLDSIQQCIETLEQGVLDLESGSGQAAEVMERLGLSHVKLPSAQVITLLDMLADGITPMNQDIVSAFLGVCEAHKKLLYALAGFLEQGAGVLRSGKELAPAQVDAPIPAAPPVQAETAPAEHPEEHQDEHAQDKVHEAQAHARQAIASVRVGTDRLDKLIELVGKLMVTYAVISQAGNGDMAKTLAGLRDMDTVIGSLQTEVEAIRLVPLKQIVAPMQRLVKSLSQKIGKKVRFEIEGEDLALDKSIVESLNEPLVHLLRNALDHGLEPAAERAALGKDETGTVRLSALRKGETAYLLVSDDGRGLDPERIRRKAVEKGLMKESDQLPEAEILQFILKSGFSTAEKITDVSGRGVGMDAVVNAIRVGLGGDILIESDLGKGATFTITIPLSRSADEGIVDALVCRLGQEVFLIPSRDVVEIYAPAERDVVALPGGRETVDVRGEVHALLRLDRFLDIPSDGRPVARSQAVVVRVGDARAAILVDEVLRQQQVVITGFTVPVQDIFALPILGLGMMGESDAVVVNVEELLRHFLEQQPPPAASERSLTALPGRG